jgi:hypothetical protein
MRTQSVILLATLAVPALAAPPPDAEVIFYNGSLAALSAAPLAKHAAFVGWLYDGNHLIGFVQPKRFLMLHLSPGLHKFSASMSTKHPAENSVLSLDLSEGERYFIRVQDNSGFLSVLPNKGRLDLVGCQIAVQELPNARPTNLKKIEPAMRDKVSTASSLSPCTP